LGTTGVGKTELGKALAEFLFNNDQAMVRIDMSEYQERHSVSRLIGAPPGYVVYDESGELTEAVRRKPYSVVLLDEIEKAHPDVFNILLQVLDDGRLTDNKGRVVDFKNTIIIMTSNIGSHIIQERFSKLTEENEVKVIDDTRVEVMDLLRKTIRPEFLNRIDEIIMFTPLTKKEIHEIVSLMFNQVKKKLAKNNVTIDLTGKAIDKLAEIGYDPQFGARPLKRVIQKEVLNELSKMILSGKVTSDQEILVDVEGDQFVFRNQ
jgi:ATP-dependent Clp protease ATP-binding subunit ClpB